MDVGYKDFGGDGIVTASFLFPGQGAQIEGMIHHLPQHPQVARTIEEAYSMRQVRT